MSLRLYRRLAVVAALALALALELRDTSAQAPAATPPPAASFVNVRVLRGLSQVELNTVMESFNAALGVECTHCHVIGRGAGLSSAALDEKPQKDTARRMITMVMDLRKAGFPVECVTCHAGHVRPQGIRDVMDPDRLKNMVLADEAERARERRAATLGAGPVATETPAPRALPEPAAIFARYEAAIGGRAAIDALSTLRATGTLTRENGQTTRVALAQKAPDKTLTVQPAPGGSLARVVVNGQQGWRGNGASPGPIPGDHWPAIELEARFFRTLKLDVQYASAVVLADPRRLDGRGIYTVEAAVRDDTVTDRLFFDAENGLLLRRDTFKQGLLSPTVIQTEYADYRSVGDLRLPFVITRTSYTAGVSRATITWESMQANVPIADAEFDRPTVAVAPSR